MTDPTAKQSSKMQPLSPANQRTTPPQFTGFALRDGRRAGFCWDERPRCPAGHSHRRALVTDTIDRCQHRASRDAAPCDMQFYAVLFTAGGSAKIRGTGERVWLVVEITRQHTEEMRRRPMIFLEKLSLLDCVLPGVEIDLTLRGTEETDG